MAKPLRSSDPNPKSIQFSHFGVLDDGKRSKGAAVTSIVVNGLILAAILIVGTLIKTNPIMAKKLTELTLPPQPPPPPSRPLSPPPPPPPKPPALPPIFPAPPANVGDERPPYPALLFRPFPPLVSHPAPPPAL